LDAGLLRLLPLEPLIRLIAARSFTLYLLHFPLMHLLIAATLHFGTTPLWGGLIAVATIGIPLLIAAPIENQRHWLRPAVRRVLQRFLPTGGLAA
jgi:peptidoglycan/LPS O-acetylase OafA/YrhL